MSEYEVRVWKSHGGWEAKTRVSLGPVKDHAGEDAERVLSLRTAKAQRGGVYSFASVATVRGGVESFLLFGDFSKRLPPSDGPATEKRVRAVHATSLAELPQIIEEARAFYAKKEAAAAE